MAAAYLAGPATAQFRLQQVRDTQLAEGQITKKTVLALVMFATGGTAPALAPADLVAAYKAGIAAEIVDHAGSDLVCYRADLPPDLVVRQAEHWNPVIDWALAAPAATPSSPPVAAFWS